MAGDDLGLTRVDAPRIWPRSAVFDGRGGNHKVT